MTILCDKEIALECSVGVEPMIRNFIGKQTREINGKKVISYGLSSYGYDLRLSSKFFVFDAPYHFLKAPNRPKFIDPLAFDPSAGIELHKEDYLLLAPNNFALGSSIEYFDMPRDILGLFMGKSSYARAGLTVGMTPIEPGFRGNITIELANTTKYPIRVYANQGIAQVCFFKGEPCAISYSDRGGKYMEQTGVTLPKV